jgi:ATP-binding cassette subfamily F protein 3
VLKNALLQYEGSLILVSHDRDFLQGLTSKVYEFKNHQMHAFTGDVYDFLAQRKMETLNELQSRTAASASASGEKVSSNKELWEQKKQREADDRKKKNRLRKLEDELELLQRLLADTEERLANPEGNAEAIASGELYKAYESIKAQIEEKETEWLELSE